MLRYRGRRDSHVESANSNSLLPQGFEDLRRGFVKRKYAGCREVLQNPLKHLIRPQDAFFGFGAAEVAVPAGHLRVKTNDTGEEIRRSASLNSRDELIEFCPSCALKNADVVRVEKVHQLAGSSGS